MDLHGNYVNSNALTSKQGLTFLIIPSRNFGTPFNDRCLNFFEGSRRRAHAPLFPLYPVSAESNLIISLLSMMNYFSTTRLFALSQRYKMEILDNLNVNKWKFTNFEVFQSCPPYSDQLLDCH